MNAVRYATTHAVNAGKHKVVVVGAGSGGLSVANQLYNSFKANGKELQKGDVAVIDAAKVHHFQPGWTLVGAGLKAKQDFMRPTEELIPQHLTHIPSNVATFSPSSNSLTLEGGETVKYDYLIVAAGLQINYGKVKGLTEALARPLESRISTIYSYDTCDATWDLIESTRVGQKALFTQPFGPVKCAGAPQKMAYMAHDRFKRTGRFPGVGVEFVTGLPVMFGVPHYSEALDKLRRDKGIEADFAKDLIEVRSEGQGEGKRVAVFKDLKEEGKTIEKEFDMMHVTPPMGPLEFIKKSPLADAAGWVDVSASSLQHTKFPNVFSLGDCSSLPTSKTAAAITAQTPVLVENLSKLMETGRVGEAVYDGYSSCPLFTGYGSVSPPSLLSREQGADQTSRRAQLMLAEFGYGGKPLETFGIVADQRVPRRPFYHLAKDVFPYAYFRHMVKGEWFGPKGLVPPVFPA
ncbi:hypothetical protein QFC19_006744 [Naganishia cerealis]|uniref:Uncharacterized protein n=1 Tax=Naganishia cerealis TaxID=610337 RepID=A0ACC2VEF0_9TREE|nr:hypothetical protein QFC19_006744 [Naganishia cerealis]